MSGEGRTGLPSRLSSRASKSTLPIWQSGNKSEIKYFVFVLSWQTSREYNILLLGCCTRAVFPKLLKLADHNSLKQNLADHKIAETNSVDNKIEHLCSEIDNLCD